MSLIKMEDGSEVNFGERGKVKFEVTWSDEVLSIVWMLLTGNIFKFQLEGVKGGLDSFTTQALVYGIVSRMKIGLNGVEKEGLAKAVGDRVDAFNNGVFTLRNSSPSLKLTQVQTAYSSLTGKDKEATLAAFTEMSAEDKKELAASAEIRLEILKLKQEALLNEVNKASNEDEDVEAA